MTGLEAELTRGRAPLSEKLQVNICGCDDRRPRIADLTVRWWRFRSSGSVISDMSCALGNTGSTLRQFEKNDHLELEMQADNKRIWLARLSSVRIDRRRSNGTDCRDGRLLALSRHSLTIKQAHSTKVLEGASADQTSKQRLALDPCLVTSRNAGPNKTLASSPACRASIIFPATLVVQSCLIRFSNTRLLDLSSRHSFTGSFFSLSY